MLQLEARRIVSEPLSIYILPLWTICYYCRLGISLVQHSCQSIQFYLNRSIGETRSKEKTKFCQMDATQAMYFPLGHHYYSFHFSRQHIHPISRPCVLQLTVCPSWNIAHNELLLFIWSNNIFMAFLLGFLHISPLCGPSLFSIHPLVTRPQPNFQLRHSFHRNDIINSIIWNWTRHRNAL